MSSSSPNRLVVRDAAPSDLGYTARQHEALLPHGLFPHLGQAFLRRWHGTFLQSPYGIALVAEQVGESGPVTVGFLIGSTDQVRLVEDVVARHRLPLTVAGAGALLLRPRLAVHFVRTRAKPYLRRLARVPRRSAAPVPVAGPRTDDGGPPVRVAVITAVTVDAAFRSSGAGRALVDRFVVRAALSGAEDARLTTVAGPGGAGRFYEKLGWQYEEEHLTRDGMAVSTYRLTPTTRPATDARARSVSRGGG
ncbi:GNAT family N-acetyltransferase [Aquipuribacter hungaricus]|uniref:GNAT family N-acetyltransferase n=1 Tax=Aquipuribacter hungaricus TaxID=545624 RepID=A0ABV7WN85_9MICO